MENAATMGTLLHEMGLVLQGLIDSGYSEQFERIIFNTTSDFHINFPENKNFFALFDFHNYRLLLLVSFRFFYGKYAKEREKCLTYSARVWYIIVRADRNGLF